MNKTIQDISDIRFGLYTQPHDSGEVAYIQLRQFDDNGRLISKTNEFINIDKKIEAHLLRDGDVLFVGKGNRLFAWCYRNSEGPAVASSIFFVVRPDQKLIWPEFLAAILNAAQSKGAFQQLGRGTSIFSIRKSELGAFQVPIPPIQQQKIIAALADLHQQEIELSKKIIAEKQKLHSAVIINYINESSTIKPN